jgi:hypothetical protein
LKKLVKDESTIRSCQHRVLTAVELVGLGILLSQLVGSVGDGVLEAASLASLAGEDNVESVDEEGGSSSNENVAELPVKLVDLSSVKLARSGCSLPVLSGELKDERHDGSELRSRGN